MKKDLAASIRARLLAIARAEGADFNQVLVRFALERMLYRLSQSAHSDRFLLKGALLFALWYDMPHRPTRDADLLGFGASDLASIVKTFRDIAGVAVEAIFATFTRRGTAVPKELPIGLSNEFAADPSRQALWTAFLKKNNLGTLPLTDVVARLRSVLAPTMDIAARQSTV